MMGSNEKYQGEVEGREEDDSFGMQILAVSLSDCSSLSGQSLQDSFAETEGKLQPQAVLRTSGFRTFLSMWLVPMTDSVDGDPSTQTVDPLRLGFRQLFDLPETNHEALQTKFEIMRLSVNQNTVMSCDDTSISESNSGKVQTDGLKEALEGDNRPTPMWMDANSEKTEVIPPPSFLETLQFEAEQTGMAFPAFMCYCVSHLAVYEVIYGVLVELSDLRIQNFFLFHMGLMVAGLLVLRCTGFLWYFLPGRRYRRSRREMKKRQPWDSKVTQWLEEKSTLVTVLNVIGFYLFYISVSFFWNQFMFRFIDQREELFKLLPSTQHYERVVRDAFSGLVESTNITSDDSSCSASREWDVADFDFLYYKVAKSSYYQYSGYAAAPLYSVSSGVVVFVSAATLSIYFLSRVGFAFSDSW